MLRNTDKLRKDVKKTLDELARELGLRKRQDLKQYIPIFFGKGATNRYVIMHILYLYPELTISEIAKKIFEIYYNVRPTENDSAFKYELNIQAKIVSQVIKGSLLPKRYIRKRNTEKGTVYFLTFKGVLVMSLFPNLRSKAPATMMRMFESFSEKQVERALLKQGFNKEEISLLRTVCPELFVMGSEVIIKFTLDSIRTGKLDMDTISNEKLYNFLMDIMTPHIYDNKALKYYFDIEKLKMLRGEMISRIQERQVDIKEVRKVLIKLAKIAEGLQ